MYKPFKKTKKKCHSCGKEVNIKTSKEFWTFKYCGDCKK